MRWSSIFPFRSFFMGSQSSQILIPLFFHFLLLSLAILKYRNIVLRYKYSSLTLKNRKKSSFYEEKKFGRIDSRLDFYIEVYLSFFSWKKIIFEKRYTPSQKGGNVHNNIVNTLDRCRNEKKIQLNIFEFLSLWKSTLKNTQTQAIHNWLNFVLQKCWKIIYSRWK